MADDKVCASLRKFDIDIDDSEMREVFDAIDLDGSGEVGLEDFKDGFVRMRGPATAKDVLKIQMSVERLSRRLSGPVRGPQGQMWANRRIDNLVNAVNELTRRVGSL